MDSVEERWVALQASAPPRPTSAPSAEVLAALKAHRRAERAFLSELEPQLRERLTGKRRKAVDTEAAARAGGIANQTPVDALEFFSGIGCLHFGLCAAQRAAAAATVAAKHTQKDSQADVSQRSSTATASPKLTTAPQGWSTRSLTVQPFEIHDVANKVYAHNFRGHDGYRQPCTQDIRSLTAAQLDAREAWLWLLSPPCQPYTRLGKRRDHEDPRAAALLHLISLLPTLMRPPTHLLLENVVGFEVSETARRMRHALTSLGYEWREYHISPTDLGLPNQRLRYFLLARRREHSAVEPSDANVSCTARGEEAVSPPIRCIPQNWDDSRPQARSSHPAATPLSYFLDDERGSVELLVSASMLERYGHLLDVRSREDSHCLCFTKNYTRSATGAGSVLATVEAPAHGAEALDEAEMTKLTQPRWFSVAEVARLHGFGFEPQRKQSDGAAAAALSTESGGSADTLGNGAMPVLSWPHGLNDKVKYQLLGNSMHVGVVRALAMLLLGESS